MHKGITFLGAVIASVMLTMSCSPSTINSQGSPIITSVDVSNQTLTISGSNLDQVNQVHLSGPSVETDLQILSSTATQLTAGAISATQLLVNSTYSLFVANANAASTQATLTFTIPNRSIQGAQLGSDISIATTGNISAGGLSAVGTLSLSNSANTWNISTSSSGTLDFSLNNILKASIASSGSWSVTSDERLKKNFHPIDGALEKLKKIRGLYYQFKTEKDSDPRHVGVIAQEVRKVLPEAVLEQGQDKHLSVSYSQLIPLVIEAVKDLETQVQALKKENETLSSELKKLRSDTHHNP